MFRLLVGKALGLFDLDLLFRSENETGIFEKARRAMEKKQTPRLYLCSIERTCS